MGAGIPLAAGDDDNGGGGEWVGGDMGSNLSASFEFLPPLEDGAENDLNGGGGDGGWEGGDHASASSSTPKPPAKMKKKKSSKADGNGRPGGGLKKRKESFCGKATLAETSLITQAFDAVAVGGDEARPGYLDYREGTAKAFKVCARVCVSVCMHSIYVRVCSYVRACAHRCAGDGKAQGMEGSKTENNLAFLVTFNNLIVDFASIII